MSDHLAFDAETGARLERLYLSSDVKRRREMASDALRPQEGQHILDVGCGPGFHAAELAELVGSSGRVWRVYGDKAMETIELQLADTERVWCVEPWEDVASAADILGIGPTYLLPEQLGVGQREVDRIDDGDAFARQRPWQSPGGGSM